ncbi:NUDIX domain-containing protein [Phaeosphaeriaceae sp. PMI808]|nr:NUDIX domain-containing protein [Phaeosphaeriaceae sp. PMI808]
MATNLGAESSFVTQQYDSSIFLESCGTVLFDLADPSNIRVCLCNIVDTNEWVLPKGRRNIDESRKETAVREVYEETGYPCKLLPVMMSTRATLKDGPADAPDAPILRDNLTEPFMCTSQELPGQGRIRMIWWFIAVLDTDQERGLGEDIIRPEFFHCDEAVNIPLFEHDREVLRKALEIVDRTIDES